MKHTEYQGESGRHSHSVELPSAIASGLKRFDIGDVDWVAAVNHSYSSENYTVETARGSFFIKCRGFTSPERTREILAAETFFAQLSLPVYPAVPARDGSQFTQVDGQKMSLYPLLDGQVIERGALTTEHLRTIGETLAHMHEAGRDAPLPIHKRAAVNTHAAAEGIDNLLGRLPVNLSRQDLLVLELLDLKQRMIRQMKEVPNLPQDHLIHGDFQEKNLLFESPASVAAIVDFDNSEIAPRSLEVCRTLDKLCFNGKFDDAQFERAGTLLTAYAKHYGMDAEELTTGIKLYYAYKVTNLWREQQIYVSGNEKPHRFIATDLAVLQYMDRYLEAYIARLVGFLG